MSSQKPAYQIDANRTGLAGVAGAVAMLHLSVAALSAGQAHRCAG